MSSLFRPLNLACVLGMILISVLAGRQQALAQSDEVDFSARYSQIVQIAVASTGAGAKSSFGSGFQVSADGLILTNYHVISSYIDSPDTHNIQYSNNEGVKGSLTLLDFDVVADLALLKRSNPSEDYFTFSSKELPKGERVYALGNPGDWGVIMIPGPNNGAVAHSFEERVLFSGSLNSGMSGGPSLNKEGQVVGINVATAGSQLSFLIPAKKAINLVAANRVLDINDYQSEIASQLKRWQSIRVNELIEKPWSDEEFANRNLVGKMRYDFQCWGDTNEDNEDRKIEIVKRVCDAHDNVYINNGLRVGQIRYSFKQYRSLKLNRFQFADARYGHLSADNYSNHKYSTNYQCKTDFINRDQQASEKTYYKVTTCVRAYKQFNGLYDSIILVENHQNLDAFSAYLSLSAVDKDQVKAMNRKFIGEVI